MLEMAGIAGVLVLAWFWLDSLKARDGAVLAARKACMSEGLQFLDESMSVDSVRPMRDDGGTLRLRRVYSFEYSDTGNNRRPGCVVMLGYRVLMLNIGLRVMPDDRTLH